jgi:hypothetical protein
MADKPEEEPEDVSLPEYAQQEIAKLLNEPREAEARQRRRWAEWQKEYNRQVFKEITLRREAEEGPAPWQTGLSHCVLNRLRLIIPSLHGHYHRLAEASAAKWGQTLTRYAAFQRLRRQASESQVDHLARQTHWLSKRRAWERENRDFSDDIRAAWPPDSADGAEIPLGTWIASTEQIAGSKLEYTVSISPTGRVLVFDVASDKELLMARISELIDRERELVGIALAPRRGPAPLAERRVAAMRRLLPKLVDYVRQEAGLQTGPPYPAFDWRPEPANSEQREFLKAIREHCVVPLWDMQLAGFATRKLATAQALYPKMPEKRSLLAKLRRAEELQQETLSWIPRLRAVVGRG